MNPHPLTYMGDVSRTCDIYVWHAYILEGNMILRGTHVKKEIRSQSLMIRLINQVDVRPISLKGWRELDPPRMSPFVVPTTTSPLNLTI